MFGVFYTANMKKVLNIYKPVGETPFGVIRKFKEKNLEYKDVSMTYAGRLDPLAEGVLVLLASGAVHEKEKYLGLDKEYEAEILFGFKTDTFDILGLPIDQIDSLNYRGPTSIVEKSDLEKLKGDFVFKLPAYSSFKIKSRLTGQTGKPLFWWAREGRLSEIEIPKRKTKIYDIKLIDSHRIESSELLNLIINKINLVKGDFRQDEIKEQWQKLLSGRQGPAAGSNRYNVVDISVSCSSGTYVRSIANKLGGVLLDLKRTKVGDFNFKDSMIIY